MNRQEFLNLPEVRQFVDWAAHRLTSIRVDFNIRSSSKVPGGVAGIVTGLDEVILHYRWRSDARGDGSWHETVDTLRRLRNALNNAANESEVLAACFAILAWGGDRNPNKGAGPFLSDMAARNTLLRYIADARDGFRLDQAVIGADPPVIRMNAMLTKIHALTSPDGLPIYDSRVAAAIASIIEIWRRESGVDAPLSPALSFPATDAKRTVTRLFANAAAPRILRYAAGDPTRNTKDWAEAKIRLAWLMHAVLERNGELLAEHGLNRMHAFEASLFMIGYDVMCLAADARG